MSHDQTPFSHAAVSRLVQNVLRSQTRDRDLIDDICQKIIVVCLQREQDQGPLPHPWKPYIVKAALNMLRDEGRRLGRSRKLQDFLRQRREASSQEDPAQMTEESDQFDVLRSLLNKLPPSSREIAKLKIVDEWTYPRIAEDKGLSVSTVKRRFGEAKARLAPLVRRHFFN